MSLHVTRYKTENGKTHKAEEPAAKPAEKNEAQGRPGTDGKAGQPAAPAKQGA